MYQDKVNGEKKRAGEIRVTLDGSAKLKNAVKQLI